MAIAEEFGKYILLKKLKEDSLGETFRAGKTGKDSIEQVVLLRVFNGQGINTEKLWQKIADRGAVQQALRSPNIGSGLDLGRVRSYPYTAYDYISGKDLATLFAQATRLHSPIPTDHVLLIAERISLALAAAYETKVHDERILHGFLVPPLVVVSNEGETRLLGFEVAAGLRDLAAGGWVPPEFRSYLAPEIGAAPSKADDVYSLGAIFFELLTGEPLPPAPADGYGGVIDAAELANEGTPLPAPIAALLKKSLVPRDQRIPDAVSWHKAISKLMIDGNYSSTTFNLAFFMHNLFRDDIERESQELQSEKSLELPKRAAVAASAAAAAPAPPVAAEPRSTTAPGVPAGYPPPPAPAQGSRMGLWIGLIVLLLVAAGGGGWYFLLGPGKAKPAAPPQQVAAAVPPAPASAPGMTPEQIQAQIQQIIEARSKEMQDKFKSQYDEQLKQLEKQLQESRKAERTEPRGAAPVVPPPAPEPAPATETRPAPSRPVEPPPAAPVNPQPATQPPASAEPERSAPPPAPAPAPVQPAAQPAARPQPRTQVGDLVQLEAGVTPPKRISPLEPRYPQAARKMNRVATVNIRVLVDERGRVLQAETVGERAGFGFDEAALEAARQATFQPAVKDGVRVKIWTTLRIAFRP